MMTTANVRSQLEKKLRDAYKDIIDGKNVKRSKHELIFGGVDVSNVFIEEMGKKNFLPATVGGVECAEGRRVPAFTIEESFAFFGWVFWEKVTEARLRKLFGSVVRNEKGEWAIQISPGNQKIIYANHDQALDLDIDHPFEC